MTKVVAKSDFVSFRPGDLAGELGKRADSGEISIMAKAMLKSTFALLKEVRARLRHLFGPAEMQAIVAAIYDDPCEPDQVVARISDAVNDPSKLTPDIIRRYRVNQAEFLEKIRALDPAATFAIADGVNQLRRLPFDEMMGLNALPSLDALRRVGLVAAQGSAAWGFCVVILKEVSFYEEYVLRPNPATLKLEPSPLTIDELALQAIEHARLAQAGQRGPAEEQRSYWVCYQLAEKTGWRYFRVEQNDDKTAKVVQIPRKALINDLRDGSLNHPNLPQLVLAGLNAPDEQETIEEPASRGVSRSTGKRSAPPKRREKPGRSCLRC